MKAKAAIVALSLALGSPGSLLSCSPKLRVTVICSQISMSRSEKEKEKRRGSYKSSQVGVQIVECAQAF